MTATIQPEAKSTSRRALLAGALGGLGAWAASAIGRTSPVRAGVDGDVVLGGMNFPTLETSLSNQLNNNNVLSAQTDGAGTALSGSGQTGIGIAGTSAASNHPAMLGRSTGDNTGVQGFSGITATPTAPAKTGVFGYAAQDAASVGVRGESPTGFGVYGKTTGTGFAGYFNGKTFMSQFVEIAEMSTPAAPGGNRARLFVRDNGLGKTQLCVRFPTGAVKVLATES